MEHIDLGFVKFTPMSVALIIIVLVSIAIIWNLQRDKDNQVDIKDLICSNGKINERKFTRFSAWLVSTWGFVYLIVDQRFSEWYFTGYMALWAGNALLDKYLDLRKKDQQDPPANASG